MITPIPIIMAKCQAECGLNHKEYRVLGRCTIIHVRQTHTRNDLIAIRKPIANKSWIGIGTDRLSQPHPGEKRLISLLMGQD
jgi:hypothetical protein